MAWPAAILAIGVASATACTAISGVNDFIFDGSGGAGSGGAGSGGAGSGGAGSGGAGSTSSASSSSSTDSTSSTSSGTDICGDGIVQPPEECDDGNQTPNDGCTDCVVDCGGMDMVEVKDPMTYHCYRLVATPTLTWQDAKVACASAGLQLASITSLEEFTFINTVTPQHTWIGATDAAMEGTFVWVDGEPMTYTAWASGEPSDTNAGEDCVETGNAGFWNDNDCSKLFGYLCERTPAGRP